MKITKDASEYSVVRLIVIGYITFMVWIWINVVLLIWSCNEAKFHQFNSRNVLDGS